MHVSDVNWHYPSIALQVGYSIYLLQIYSFNLQKENNNSGIKSLLQIYSFILQRGYRIEELNYFCRFSLAYTFILQKEQKIQELNHYCRNIHLFCKKNREFRK